MLQHRRMDHSGTEDLDPAGALARRTTRAATDAALHVHLRRGFGERKEARPEAGARRAEESQRKAIEGRLEVDEADAFVDAQSFDLSKGGGVRRVEEISAIHVPRNEDPDGWRIALERSHLYGRGVGAE